MITRTIKESAISENFQGKLRQDHWKDFIDIVVNIFFLISGFANNWDITSWFAIIKWYPHYIFWRFIVVFVIYNITKKKKLPHTFDMKILPVYKDNIRKCIIFINTMLNVVTSFFVIIHQVIIFGA